MSIKRNLKLTVVNVLSATTSIVKVSSEIVLKTSELAVASADGIIPAMVEVVRIPKSAYAGYVQEDRDISVTEADTIADAVFDKDVATAIRASGRAVGKLSASLTQGWDEDWGMEEPKKVTTK